MTNDKYKLMTMLSRIHEMTPSTNQNWNNFEKEYRSLKDVLSYSALKTFVKDRNKFFKEFILGEKKEEALSNDMILGNLVDCELFTPEDFDTKFHINAIEKPTGQMGELCDDLLARTANYINSQGECEVDFGTIFTNQRSFIELQKVKNRL